MSDLVGSFEEDVNGFKVQILVYKEHIFITQYEVFIGPSCSQWLSNGSIANLARKYVEGDKLELESKFKSEQMTPNYKTRCYRRIKR